MNLTNDLLRIVWLLGVILIVAHVILWLLLQLVLSEMNQITLSNFSKEPNMKTEAIRLYKTLSKITGLMCKIPVFGWFHDRSLTKYLRDLDHVFILGINHLIYFDLVHGRFNRDLQKHPKYWIVMATQAASRFKLFCLF